MRIHAFRVPKCDSMRRDANRCECMRYHSISPAQNCETARMNAKSCECTRTHANRAWMHFFGVKSFSPVIVNVLSVTVGFGAVPRRKGFRNEGRVEFLVLLPEIRKALSEGRSLKGFYLENRGRLRLSYSQLSRYVQAFGVRAGVEKAQALSAAPPVPLQERPPQYGRPSPDSENRQAMPAPPQPAASEPQRARAPVAPNTEPPRDFHYDPMDAYRIKFD
jgi:hypothetical protein